MRVESFSSISTFLRCPKQYEEKYLKKVKQKQTEKMKRGSDIHLEISQNKERSEPAKFAKRVYKKTGKDYFNVAQPGQLAHNLFECHLGLKKNENELEFCNYDDKECYFHGIADLIILFYKKQKKDNPEIEIEKIRVLDWKTGKYSGNKRQLEVYALMIGKMLEIEQLEGQFVYLDREKESKVYQFSIEKLKEVENWIVENIEEIRKIKVFQEKPNYFCKWCKDYEKCPLHQKIEIVEPSSTLFVLESL